MEQDKLNAQGRITFGIQANTLVRRTVDFVYSQLPRWRDDPDRPTGEAEEYLNGALCDFLNVAASGQFPMVHFRHEQRQAERRRVDLAAKPAWTIQIEQHQYTKYDPILVLEGKRLPTPGSGREREYVTGGDLKSGGIQRLRLGLHGGELTIAAMIGYIKPGSLSQWHRTVNEWISDLGSAMSDPTMTWKTDDLLRALKTDARSQTGRCKSNHERRSGSTRDIQLEHLWVEM